MAYNTDAYKLTGKRKTAYDALVTATNGYITELLDQDTSSARRTLGDHDRLVKQVYFEVTNGEFTPGLDGTPECLAIEACGPTWCLNTISYLVQQAGY